MAQTNPSFSEPISKVTHSDGYIRQKTLLKEHVPFSAATLWRLVAAGKFPKPVKLTDQITAWRRSSILIWEMDPAGYKADGDK